MENVFKAYMYNKYNLCPIYFKFHLKGAFFISEGLGGGWVGWLFCSFD